MKYLVLFTWPTSCLMHKGHYELSEVEMFCSLFGMKMEVNEENKTIHVS